MPILPRSFPPPTHACFEAIQQTVAIHGFPTSLVPGIQRLLNMYLWNKQMNEALLEKAKF